MAIGREKTDLPVVGKRSNPGRRGGLIPRTREAWTACLAVCDGSVAELARRFQYNRTYVYSVLKAYGIEPPRVGGGNRGNWGDLTD